MSNDDWKILVLVLLLAVLAMFFVIFSAMSQGVE